MRKTTDVLLRVLNKLSSKTIMNCLFIALIAIQISLIILNYISHFGLLELNQKNTIINFGVLVSTIIVIVLLISFNFIAKSIKEITQYTNILSKGKLNANDLVIEGNNDFSSIARAINNLKSNLLFFLDQTKGNILVLSDSIEKVTMSMEMASSGNEQVASSMQEIAYKSQEQLNLAKDTVSKGNEVKKSIEAITIHIKDVEVIASEADSVAETGKDSLDIYNKNINLISESMAGTSEFIKELKLSAKEIGSMVSFIVGLSRQLKLLSLNASIEAARSGEAGKGFAVVAQEITQLSNATKEGIDKINVIVTNILQGSDNVEESIEKSIKDFERGRETFSNATKVFKEINEKNTVLLKQVSDIVSEISNINSNIKNTAMLSEKVNNSAAVVSQSTEEIVAIIEEEVAEFQQINSSMAALHSVLNKVENLTARFELDIKPKDESPVKPLRIIVMMPSFGDVWNTIHFGALYGKKVLKSKNTTVEIIPIKSFSPEEYLNAVKTCLKDGCDGIVTPGFFEEHLQNAPNMNIPVVTFNVDIKEKTKRLAFVGQNSYESGKVAAKIMADKIGGKGKLLILASDKHFENMELRKKGFTDAFIKNKNIDVVEVLEIPFEEDKVYQIVKEYLKKNSNINGIFNTAGGVLGLARAIEESNISSKLTTIVYDATKEVLRYIDRGVITCAIGQDPFRQGHDSLIYLYNYLVTGEKPENQNTWTKIEVVDINNVRYFLD